MADEAEANGASDATHRCAALLTNKKVECDLLFIKTNDTAIADVKFSRPAH